MNSKSESTESCSDSEEEGNIYDNQGQLIGWSVIKQEPTAQAGPSAMDKLALDFVNKLIEQDEKEEAELPQAGPVAANQKEVLVAWKGGTGAGEWVPVKTYSEDKTTYTVEMVYHELKNNKLLPPHFDSV